MLSLGAKSVGSEKYYLDLAVEYYSTTSGGEPPGRWWNGGATREAGLAGKVTAKVLKEAFAGFLPDGKKLGKSAGRDNRLAATDMVFSAPKGVSILHALGSSQVRSAIEDVHHDAVSHALEEAQALVTARLGKAGSSGRIAGKWVAALFDHFTSRAQDPDLHTHCLVLNALLCDDGKWRSFDPKVLYECKMVLGAAYRLELAHQLHERLGLELTRLTNAKGKLTDTFDIKQFAEEWKGLCEALSTRRKEILDLLEAKGEGYSAKKAAQACLESRAQKGHIAYEDLQGKCWAEASLYGVGRRELDALVGKAQAVSADRDRSLTDVVARAIQNLTEEQSHFADRDLRRAIYVEAQGQGFAAAVVQDAVSNVMRAGEQVIGVGQVHGREHYSTPEILAEEKDLFADIELLRQNKRHRVDKELLDKIRNKATNLNKEQRAALIHITRQSRGIACVTGYAGTGKSTLLKEAAKAWRKSGLKVIGCAVSGIAAENLEKSAGIKSCTLARLLGVQEFGFKGDLQKNVLHDLKHHATMLVRAARKKKTWKNPRIGLTSKSVVVLDEASMVGTQALAKLVRAVKRAKAKLVLVGDPMQLQPLTAGAPFAHICKEFGAANLTEVVRQRETWARRAVKLFAHGRSARALKEHARRGLVEVTSTRSEAIDALVAAYAQSGLVLTKYKLALAPTNAEVHLLNSKIQAARKEKKHLGKACIEVGGTLLYTNDQVIFRENSMRLGVKNGTIGTVQRLDRWKQTVYVRLDDGKVVTVALKKYASLELGYAVTSYRAQGTTVNHCFVLAGGPMTHRQAAYVEASRARVETRFFLEKAAAGEKLCTIVKAMEQDRAKSVASAVSAEKKQTTERDAEQSLRP